MSQTNSSFHRIKKSDLEKQRRENDGCKYLLIQGCINDAVWS